MYRPTLAIDAIGLDDPVAIEIAMENMSDVLMALVSIDRRYLRKFPDRFPLLYESGVRYDRLDPPPGSACGDDDFQDVVTILEHPDHPRLADCEDLACWRVAELVERFGIKAVPFIRLHADLVHDVTDGQMKPRHLYHIMVRWPDGLASYPDTVYRDHETGAMLEDPSRVLGMTGEG
jgi:hypothetical protein